MEIIKYYKIMKKYINWVDNGGKDSFYKYLNITPEEWENLKQNLYLITGYYWTLSDFKRFISKVEQYINEKTK